MIVAKIKNTVIIRSNPNVKESFIIHKNPKFALVPSPKHLWCSKRSDRIRNWFKKREIPVYINGVHGHVAVRLFGNRIEVVPEIVAADPCN